MRSTSMLSWSDRKRARVALAGLLTAAAVTASSGLSISAALLPAARAATPVAQVQTVVPSRIFLDGVSWSATHRQPPPVGRFQPDGVSWS
jgi:hypothetical protein